MGLDSWAQIGMIEGSLQVKLPTICRDGKWGGKSQRGVKTREDQRRERVGSKKMQMREKVGKSRFTVDLGLRRVEK